MQQKKKKTYPATITKQKNENYSTKTENYNKTSIAQLGARSRIKLFLLTPIYIITNKFVCVCVCVFLCSIAKTNFEK